MQCEHDKTGLNVGVAHVGQSCTREQDITGLNVGVAHVGQSHVKEGCCARRRKPSGVGSSTGVTHIGDKPIGSYQVEHRGARCR